MNSDLVRNLATDFRAGLESIPTASFCRQTSIGIAPFPAGCCDEASLLLAAYLADNSVSGVLRVFGECGGHQQELDSHVWLKVESLIVDITADQVSFANYKLGAVFVAESSVFHSSFKTSAEESVLADFRVYLRDDPHALAGFQENYDLLLKRVRK